MIFFDLSLKVDLTKTEEKDAVQKQETESSVLREEGSEVGLVAVERHTHQCSTAVGVLHVGVGTSLQQHIHDASRDLIKSTFD